MAAFHENAGMSLSEALRLANQPVQAERPRKVLSSAGSLLYTFPLT